MEIVFAIVFFIVVLIQVDAAGERARKRSAQIRPADLLAKKWEREELIDWSRFWRYHRVAQVGEHVDLSGIGLMRQGGQVYFGVYRGVDVRLVPVMRHGQSMAQMEVGRPVRSKMMFVLQLGGDAGGKSVRLGQMKKGRFGPFEVESNDLDRLERWLKRSKVEVNLCKIEQSFAWLKVETRGQKLVAEFDVGALGSVGGVEGLLRFMLRMGEME